MVVHKKGVKRAQKVASRSRKQLVKTREANVRRVVRQAEVEEKEAQVEKKK